MRERWRTVIAWSEFLGGAGGLFGVGLTGLQPSPVPLPPTFYIAAVTGFVLALQAGWLLLTRSRWGAPLSALVQALQVVQAGVGGAVFSYAAGLQVLVRVAPSGWRVSPGVNAGVWVGPLPFPAEPFVAVNLFAAAALWLLLRRGRATQATPRDGAATESTAPAA